MSCDLSFVTSTSSYVTGGGRGEGEEEGEMGPDNLPLTLSMRYTLTTPSRTPTIRNNRLHTTPTTTVVGPQLFSVLLVKLFLISESKCCKT